MVEETVILTVDLEGEDAVWLGDANTVLLPSHLNEEGRQRALCDLSARWRRSFIRVVDGVA